MKKPKLGRELAVILVIKVIVLMTIKNVWFDQPTIPKHFEQSVEQRIIGQP